MTQWEYIQIAVKVPDLLPECRKAGKDGWEVCGMTLGQIQSSPVSTQVESGFIVLMKRPLEKVKENGCTQRKHGHSADAAAGTNGPA